MSEDDSNIGEMAVNTCCANCGKAEIDDIKLRECDKCDLARYCSDECQQDHRPTHEEICKERAAELRDEMLFRQPEETHLGDCPICFLPLPIDPQKSVLRSCCCKLICGGCFYANAIREKEQRLKPTCPFCRKPVAKTKEEAKTRFTDRAEANDPNALVKIGKIHLKEGSYESAFPYLAKAAELGDAEAHYALAVMYQKEHGVEMDKERGIYHLEEAAIAGDPAARYYLGVYEGRNGRIDRAVKHFIIAANLGDDNSINALKKCYRDGDVSKDVLATALRAHHAAISAMKSPQREEAAKYEERVEG